MPQGDKRSYTTKQKRQAEHIEEGYEQRGVSKKTAEARAWATVNKMTGGGKKSGSGRGNPVDKSPAKKGGKKGGAATKKASAKSKAKTTRSSSSSRKTATKRKAPAKRKATSRKKAAPRKKATGRKRATRKK